MEDRDLTALDYFELVEVIAFWQVFLILSLFVVIHSKRDALTDSLHDLLAENLDRYLAYLPVSLHCTHTATDIYAYSIGNYSICACEHTIDRHPHTSMHIGHDGKVMEEEWQRGQVFNLTHGRLFHIVRPNLHRAVVDHLYFHCLFSFNCYTSLIIIVVPRSSSSIRIQFLLNRTAKLKIYYAIFLRSWKKVMKISKKSANF